MKRKLLLFNALAVLFFLQARAQAFTENFDDITTLAGSGWSLQNASVAVGSTNWFQGTNVAAAGPFDSYNGAANAYIGANYNNTGSVGTISNWMLTPNRTFRNGDVLTFFTRKVAPDSYADRMEVRLSTNGASTSVGSASTVGDFTTLLLSVNPSLVLGVYPTTWTQYTITISGLPAPTSGRIGFRYFVTSAGVSGTNSDYIGIDNVTYTPYVCPSFTLTAGGALTGGTRGTAYSSTLSQTGALGAPTFSVTAGALPSGLTLSATGTLSGTPTAAGTYNFTVTVSDASGCSGSQSYSIDIVNCDLNMPGGLPDYESQCAVALADLTIPTITDTCGNTIIPTTDAVFPITAQGTTTITWTYLDIYGGTATVTQDIQIDDFTEPTPDVAVLSDITASCEVLEADVTPPTATDNCSGTVTVTSDAVFPITTQGTTTITWTYTDAVGNFTTQTQDVVIADFIEPTPDVAVLADITASCEVLEADVTPPTATDNCSGTVTVTSDAVFPITTQGTTTITWTYTDAVGNFTTQTQDVVIADFIEPTPDVAVLADITASCEVLEADVTPPTATDNCSGTVTVTSDAVFPITTQGTTTITWTYTDAVGNFTTQTQDVVIADFIEPTPDVAVLADITASCEVLEADATPPTATDNCSGTVTVTSDAVFPITTQGTTTITWTYTDAVGNFTTQTQDVVIADFIEPTPDVAVLADITASCEVLEADVTPPTATDNCSGTVTVTSDAVFPITTQGTTTITWTYTDAVGNFTTQTQEVVIADFIEPTPDVAVLADITAQCEVLEADVTPPTATDNCSGTVTVTSNAVFPITAQGTTEIIWTYTDANGNSNTQTQEVMINDTTAPTPDVAALSDITASCEVLITDVTPPTATDNCTGTVTVTSDAVFPITAQGTTVIIWTFTDSHGNSETQPQDVVIADFVEPTPDVAVLTDIVAECQVLETDVSVPTATDNCSGVVTVTSDAVFPITAQGTTVITWTYTDAHGNTQTQTQDVVVVDNTDPTITLTDISVPVDINGNVTITPSELHNGTVADNCGIASVTVAPNTFTCSDLGDHIVTVTVTDIHGNTITEDATVTVTDPNNFCMLSVAHNEGTAFALYPNPAGNMLYIQPANNETLRSVTVYSTSGQAVMKTSYSEVLQKYSISLDTLAEGTYLLRLETPTGTYTKRVVKQNK